MTISAVDFLMGPAPGEPGSTTTLNGGARAPASQPYGSAALHYAQKNVTGIIPLVRSTKLPALEGTTGRDGRQTTADEYASPEMIAKYAVYNIAWRMPKGYMGLDVDHGYDDGNGNIKAGADTLAELEKTLGPLPPTWTSTARGDDSPSRIRFYKIPRNSGELKGAAGPDIDVIQHHHRYAVVAPSVHPKTGSRYRWYNPDGTRASGPPDPEDLPYLPAPWLDHLAKEQRSHEPGAGRSIEEFEGRFTDEFEPDLTGKIREKFSHKEGSRHDSMMKALGWAARAAVEGKVAARGIFDLLEEDWFTATGDTREQEFNDLLSTAVRDAPDAEDDDSDEFFLSWDDLKCLPGVEPLIDGMVNKKSVVWLSGKFGTYKTFLALAWACCIATGKAWESHEIADPGHVIYVLAEGISGIRPRAVAWTDRFNDGQPVTRLTVTPKGIDPRDPKQMAKLTRQVQKTGAKAVFFDTLHRCAPDMDENSSGDKGQGAVMKGLQKLKDDTGCTVVMLAHTGYEGVHARGSSSQEDDADDAYVIKFYGDPEDRSIGNPRILHRRKSKEGEAGQTYHLRFIQVPGPDPFQPSKDSTGYITLGDHENESRHPGGRPARQEDNVRRIMREMDDAGVPVGRSQRATRGWMIAHNVEIKGRAKDWQDAHAARNQLVADDSTAPPGME